MIDVHTGLSSLLQYERAIVDLHYMGVNAIGDLRPRHAKNAVIIASNPHGITWVRLDDPDTMHITPTAQVISIDAAILKSGEDDE